MHTALRLVLFLASVGLAGAPPWVVVHATPCTTDGPATVDAPRAANADAPAIRDGADSTAPLAASTTGGLRAAHTLPTARGGDRAFARPRLPAPTPQLRWTTHDARGPPHARTDDVRE